MGVVLTGIVVIMLCKHAPRIKKWIQPIHDWIQSYANFLMMVLVVSCAVFVFFWAGSLVSHNPTKGWPCGAKIALGSIVVNLALIAMVARIDSSGLHLSANKIIACVLWTLLLAGVALFTWVFLGNDNGRIKCMLGAESKVDTLKFIGSVIGGILAAIGVILLDQRAMTAEKGLIEERFKTAVEGLGHNTASVRIAAIYQFYYLAKDNPNQDFKNNILEILAVHLRHFNKPTEDAEYLLDVLFNKPGNVFNNTAKLEEIKKEAKIRFPKWFREGEHYTLAEEE